MKLTKGLRILITAISTLLIWCHVIWDYFHGGIPTHYILHDDNLPGIPNWIGAIVLPFFTWLLLYRIHLRVDKKTPNVRFRTLVYRFLAALLVAITVSVCFTMGIDIIDYIMLALLVLALIFPLYRSEYLLGWVFGSSFTFGAVIPMVFGSMLAAMFYILYKIAKLVIGFFGSSQAD